MKEIIKQKLLETFGEKLDTSKIRIKKGIVNNFLVYIPFYGEEKMGGVRLSPVSDGYKIFSTLLYDKFKDKGIGKGMYKHIIKDLNKKNKTLYSDDNQSEDAKRVWDKLVSTGVAEKIGDTYKSKN